MDMGASFPEARADLLDYGLEGPFFIESSQND